MSKGGHSPKTQTGIIFFMLVGGIFYGVVAGFLGPFLIAINPKLSFLNLVCHNINLIIVAGLGIICFYGAFFAPDEALDQFERPALFSSSPDAASRFGGRFFSLARELWFSFSYM
jgi:hypothetical protein